MKEAATPMTLARGDLELLLKESALERMDIDPAGVGWVPVLATYVKGSKLNFIVAIPWLPEEGEPTGEELEWFIPSMISEKDVEAMRFVQDDNEDAEGD